nr:MAG TPA: distal tail protein [Caudoviricetes sp.]
MGLKARLTSWQVSGSLRNFTTTVPGKYGVTDFGADFDYREIVVSCSIFPRHSFSALVATLDDIAAWLDPVGGLKQLVLDDVPDRYFMARLSDTVDCERLLRAAGSFTLRFLCPDPYGYALDDETFTLSQAGEHEVEREIGNTDSEPVYSLQGTISSGAVVLTTNGENLRVVGPLAAGEVLVIDTGMVTAKVTDSAGNTLRNGLPCLEELNFPVLRRGVNKVEIAVEGSAVFTELHIQAKSRWR